MAILIVKYSFSGRSATVSKIDGMHWRFAARVCVTRANERAPCYYIIIMYTVRGRSACQHASVCGPCVWSSLHPCLRVYYWDAVMVIRFQVKFWNVLSTLKFLYVHTCIMIGSWELCYSFLVSHLFYINWMNSSVSFVSIQVYSLMR